MEGGSPERYPTIYLRVQGGGGGRRQWRGGGVGIAGEKARHGGPTGMAGARRTDGGECFRGGRGGALPATGGGGGCLAGGGWRLRGGEVEDELQALDFVSNGCKID